MSSTLHKIADKLSGKDKEHDNPQSSNYGPHSSNVANQVDPRVDSDGRANPTSHVGGYGNTHTTDPYSNTGGVTTTTHHNTGVGGTHTTTTTAGPHKSDLANKLDPRVDSDMDGRNNPTSHVGGHGNTHTSGIGHGNTHTGTGGYTGTNTAVDNPQSTNTGPYSSNLMNKLDPRVDSDRDGRNNPTSHVGGHGNTHTGIGHGNTHTGTGGHTGTHTAVDNPQSTNSGPYSSNLMNKLDPRVDSDRDGRNHPTSHVGGHGNTHTGIGHGNTHTGTGGYTGTNTAVDNPQSTNTGPYSSNLMNKLDPRVDSDRDGRNDPTSRVGGHGQTQTHTHAGGVGTHDPTLGTHGNAHPHGHTGTNPTYDDPCSTNTGPHSSKLLNKLDPRVDSDQDGRNDPTSKVGGYGQTQTGNPGIGRY